MSTSRGTVEQNPRGSSAFVHPPTGSGARRQNGNVTHRNGNNNKKMSTSRRTVEQNPRGSSASVHPPTGSGVKRQTRRYRHNAGGSNTPAVQRRKQPSRSVQQSVAAAPVAMTTAAQRRKAVILAAKAKAAKATQEAQVASVKDAEPIVVATTVKLKPVEVAKPAVVVDESTKGDSKDDDNLTSFLKCKKEDRYYFFDHIVEKSEASFILENSHNKNVRKFFIKPKIVSDLLKKGKGKEIFSIFCKQLQNFSKRCMSALRKSNNQEVTVLVDYIGSLSQEEIYALQIPRHTMGVMNDFRGVQEDLKNKGLKNMDQRLVQIFVNHFSAKKGTNFEERRIGEVTKLLCELKELERLLVVYTSDKAAVSAAKKKLNRLRSKSVDSEKADAIFVLSDDCTDPMDIHLEIVDEIFGTGTRDNWGIVSSIKKLVRKKQETFLGRLNELLDPSWVVKVFESMSSGMTFQEALDTYKSMMSQLPQHDTVHPSFNPPAGVDFDAWLLERVKEITIKRYNVSVGKTYNISDPKLMSEYTASKLGVIRQIFGDDFKLRVQSVTGSSRCYGNDFPPLHGAKLNESDMEKISCTNAVTMFSSSLQQTLSTIYKPLYQTLDNCRSSKGLGSLKSLVANLEKKIIRITPSHEMYEKLVDLEGELATVEVQIGAYDLDTIKEKSKFLKTQIAELYATHGFKELNDKLKNLVSDMIKAGNKKSRKKARKARRRLKKDVKIIKNDIDAKFSYNARDLEDIKKQFREVDVILTDVKNLPELISVLEDHHGELNVTLNVERKEFNELEKKRDDLCKKVKDLTTKLKESESVVEACEDKLKRTKDEISAYEEALEIITRMKQMGVQGLCYHGLVKALMSADEAYQKACNWSHKAHVDVKKAQARLNIYTKNGFDGFRLDNTVWKKLTGLVGKVVDLKSDEIPALPDGFMNTFPKKTGRGFYEALSKLKFTDFDGYDEYIYDTHALSAEQCDALFFKVENVNGVMKSLRKLAKNEYLPELSHSKFWKALAGIFACLKLKNLLYNMTGQNLEQKVEDTKQTVEKALAFVDTAKGVVASAQRSLVVAVTCDLATENQRFKEAEEGGDIDTMEDASNNLEILEALEEVDPAYNAAIVKQITHKVYYALYGALHPDIEATRYELPDTICALVERYNTLCLKHKIVKSRGLELEKHPIQVKLAVLVQALAQSGNIAVNAALNCMGNIIILLRDQFEKWNELSSKEFEPRQNGRMFGATKMISALLGMKNLYFDVKKMPLTVRIAVQTAADGPSHFEFLENVYQVRHVNPKQQNSRNTRSTNRFDALAETEDVEQLFHGREDPFTAGRKLVATSAIFEFDKESTLKNLEEKIRSLDQQISAASIAVQNVKTKFEELGGVAKMNRLNATGKLVKKEKQKLVELDMAIKRITSAHRELTSLRDKRSLALSSYRFYGGTGINKPTRLPQREVDNSGLGERIDKKREELQDVMSEKWNEHIQILMDEGCDEDDTDDITHTKPVVGNGFSWSDWPEWVGILVGYASIKQRTLLYFAVKHGGEKSIAVVDATGQKSTKLSRAFARITKVVFDSTTSGVTGACTCVKLRQGHSECNTPEIDAAYTAMVGTSPARDIAGGCSGYISATLPEHKRSGKAKLRVKSNMEVFGMKATLAGNNGTTYLFNNSELQMLRCKPKTLSSGDIKIQVVTASTFCRAFVGRESVEIGSNSNRLRGKNKKITPDGLGYGRARGADTIQKKACESRLDFAHRQRKAEDKSERKLEEYEAAHTITRGLKPEDMRKKQARRKMRHAIAFVTGDGW